ncbi:hypothetical protein N9W51_00450 [Alphaproteobacteria bacterium]|nr:hypothetical protein [Alphaproteobacteria bacterium]
MLIRTPLRLSLVGGGSDLRYFYEKHEGMSIGFPIKKYNYIFFSDIKSNLLHIVSDKENIKTSDPNSIKDNILRAIFTKYTLNKKKAFIFSDLPYGTGLGSSSAMTVGLINAINNIKKLKMDRSKIADMAYKIEEQSSGTTVGKQDHFMSTYGGINLFTYNKNSKTKVNKINYSMKSIGNFEKYLLLIRVGGTRNATDILHDQKNNLISNNSKFENMKKILTYIPEIKKSLIQHDFKEMGKLISDTWHLKKTFSKLISNTEVDDLETFLLSQGIYGGKLLGAGSSGYFLVICNPKVKKKLISIFKTKEIININIDKEGSEIKWQL